MPDSLKAALEAIPGGPSPARAKALAAVFYLVLRQEVTGQNPALTKDEQQRLQSHYPVIMAPQNYSPALALEIYSSRRLHPVRAVLMQKQPVVLDAGCGFGSESFLFSALGAKVIAVDSSADRVEIAKKRKQHYGQMLGRELEIEFHVLDLDEYSPPEGSRITLTWLASVLAGIKDQAGLLKRIAKETPSGGKVMVSDMNLLNPLFLGGEWSRRKKTKKTNTAFRESADFKKMLRRRGRTGAVFYGNDDGAGSFDDVQFFTPGTLSELFKEVGLKPQAPSFSGFAPPRGFPAALLTFFEKTFSLIPGLRRFGYFYTVIGEKPTGEKATSEEQATGSGEKQPSGENHAT